MASWSELINEVERAGNICQTVLVRQMGALHALTGRNVIVYYSGWLHKANLRGVRMDINDVDKDAFMAVIHGLDKSKGLDLFLHTPGGEVAATESLINYLRAIFGTNIRAVVPQLAMSGGTMIACACREIIMGKQSSLGPIDPQLGGIPAHGVIEEFDRAADEIQKDHSKIGVWQPILAKYPPTFIGECQKAIHWSEEIVRENLTNGMFDGKKDAKALAEKVGKFLGDHALQKSHSRHIALKSAMEAGLVVKAMEELVPKDKAKSQQLQDAILAVHHASTILLSRTDAYKIVANHTGAAQIMSAQQAKP